MVCCVIVYASTHSDHPPFPTGLTWPFTLTMAQTRQNTESRLRRRLHEYDSDMLVALQDITISLLDWRDNLLLVNLACHYRGRSNVRRMIDVSYVGWFKVKN